MNWTEIIELSVQFSSVAFTGVYRVKNRNWNISVQLRSFQLRCKNCTKRTNWRFSSLHFISRSSLSKFSSVFSSFPSLVHAATLTCSWQHGC